MFEHLIVKNFRGFPGLHLEHLARINLIAGQNNTGKTALLEAIHLHNNSTDCQVPLTVNRIRGIDSPGKAVEDIVSWLFWGRHGSGGLVIETFDDKGVTRTLSIWLLDADASRDRFPDEEKLLRDSYRTNVVDGNLPRLVLKFEESNQPAKTCLGLFTGTAIPWASATTPFKIPSILLSSCPAGSDQDMRFFGELELAKRLEDEVVPPLKILEPKLKRLAVAPLSGELVIHGDIGLARLVPVAFMGEGVRRVLSIVLAIANAPGGVVLIDEIENGLHYSVVGKVWQAIAEAAKRTDVQVFATTHSYECIREAHEVFVNRASYDLGLYRLDRVDEHIEVATYDRETLGTSVDMNLETR
jgi:AAA domain, putative AbiEii toxin, Type IV TA system/AAA domain